jgi:haloalkane dehalogenase
MTITAKRTPDDHFIGLPDFPFEPHYVTHKNGLRMAYVDEGTRDGPVFLCLHGQPSWSYLYRKMIPVFAPAGRVIALDLFGFGRSDKPVEDAVYTFEFHRNALLEFIEALDLQDITLVCQDWGGILGLTLPMAMPARFSRLIVMNTAIATGMVPLGPGFEAWKAFNATQPDMDIAALMKRATPILSDAEAAAYGTPFPDVTYKGGVRRFPELVPYGPNVPGAAISRQAAQFWTHDWNGQSFMAVGAQDIVLTPKSMEALRSLIRGCPPAMMVEEAGHFVQEWGAPIAEAALKAFAT